MVRRVGRMETAPKPGRDVPPKKDKLPTKKKVEIFLGRKESFQARAGGAGLGQRTIRAADLPVEAAAAQPA